MLPRLHTPSPPPPPGGEEQEGGLQFVQAGVVADVAVVVFLLGAVVAQSPDFVGDSVVIGGDSTCIAERAEVFGGVKTEGPRSPHAPAFLPKKDAPCACA